MATYGYARVSTTDQDLTIQEDALRAAGCAVVRTEKRSGTSREGRSELDTLLMFVQPGDTILVTRVDRLARSMKDLQDIIHELHTKGVSLRATEQPVDTGNAYGKMFLDLLGVFAEFETNIRKERQMEGIRKAKERGVYRGKGRRRSTDIDEVRRLRAEGMGPARIARELGIGRTSVYRALGTRPPTRAEVAADVEPRAMTFDDLSPRLRSTLADMGWIDLEHLLAASENDIERVPGMGDTDRELVRGLRARTREA